MTRAVLPLLALLAACEPQPTSRSDFAAHPDAARRVAEACRRSGRADAHCANAEAGLGDAARDARIKLYKKSF